MFEAGSGLREGAGRRCDGFVADQVGDLVRTDLEGFDLGAEFAEARAGVFLVHGAVLERGPVFVACRGLGGDGGFDGVEFGVPVGVGVAVVGSRLVDRGGDEGVGVAVEVVPGLEDGFVHGGGVEAGTGAAVGAVSAAGVAGVVVVAAGAAFR
ncbi:hypothetical protein [Actinoplanes sp. NBRC 101535]|uniref:hypothetical protein n=1 Tax=Actinoplanes sp. NBRC 101535 TaxID=3032196 RepID=UPI002554EAA4|nr:hypothetical protein [Actinoplanes sp. NBRC 101535]